MCMQQYKFTSVTNARSNLHLCPCVIFLKEITEKTTEMKKEITTHRGKGGIRKTRNYVVHATFSQSFSTYEKQLRTTTWQLERIGQTSGPRIPMFYWLSYVTPPSSLSYVEKSLAERDSKNSCMRTQKSTKAEKTKLNKWLYSYSRKNELKQMT